MAALLGSTRRSAAADRAWMRGGGRQEQLVGAVPPSLRPRVADQAPRDGPLLLLHGSLREDEVLPEQHSRPAAGDGPRRASRAAGAETIARTGRSTICRVGSVHLAALPRLMPRRSPRPSPRGGRGFLRGGSAGLLRDDT